MGTRKRWTLEEKIKIVEAGLSSDITTVCRQYGVSTGTFYNWRKRYESQGEDGLKVVYDSRAKELKQAEEENRILRKLLADKEIEIEAQKELIKKKFGTSDLRKI